MLLNLIRPTTLQTVDLHDKHVNKFTLILDLFILKLDTTSINKLVVVFRPVRLAICMLVYL